MLKLFGFLVLFGLGIGGTACAPLYENLYEGVQMQKRQAEPPTFKAQAPAPSYDEYLRQRRELMEKPPNEQLPEPGVTQP